MIAAVWVVLVLLVCGGIYAAGRVLARDDMPLTRAKIIPAVLPGPTVHALSGEQVRLVGEPGPGGGGSARSGSAAGQSSYQLLYAMATAVNDAWLDRLFAGTGAE